MCKYHSYITVQSFINVIFIRNIVTFSWSFPIIIRITNCSCSYHLLIITTIESQEPVSKANEYLSMTAIGLFELGIKVLVVDSTTLLKSVHSYSNFRWISLFGWILCDVHQTFQNNVTIRLNDTGRAEQYNFIGASRKVRKSSLNYVFDYSRYHYLGDFLWICWYNHFLYSSFVIS